MQPSAPKLQPAERERIEHIASSQRMILLVLLAYLVAGWLASAAFRPGASSAAAGFVFAVVALIAIIAGLVFAVRMAKALHGPGSGPVFVILLLLPLINLITLLVLNSQATGELRRAGLRVGFLGVSASELDALRLRG